MFGAYTCLRNVQNFIRSNNPSFYLKFIYIQKYSLGYINNMENEQKHFRFFFHFQNKYLISIDWIIDLTLTQNSKEILSIGKNMSFTVS